MIVVFGSLNVDFYIQVPHLPAPGETVLGPDYLRAPGGKGANQAVAARRAGARVLMVGAVGDDDLGEEASAGLRSAAVDLSLLRRAKGKKTGMAFIVVDRAGSNQIAVASGANLAAAAEQVPDDLLGPGTLLSLQMEVEPEENWSLIERAKARGARTLLNLAPAKAMPAKILTALDWLVVNEGEARAVADSLGRKAVSGKEAAIAIAAAAGTTVIVTLGGDGALAVDGDGEAWSIGALPIDPVDTTGAGDAFVGVLAARLDESADLPSALRWASVAGGLACLKPGAQPGMPSAAEIEARLAGLEPARKMRL